MKIIYYLIWLTCGKTKSHLVVVISGSEYCRRLVERNFSKTLVRTEKNYEDFKNSTNYRICKKQHKQKDIIVKDHRRITEKFRGSVHNEFNLNLSLTKKRSLLCFITCKIIIHILYFKNLENIILK